MQIIKTKQTDHFINPSHRSGIYVLGGDFYNRSAY